MTYILMMLIGMWIGITYTQKLNAVKLKTTQALNAAKEVFNSNS